LSGVHTASGDTGTSLFAENRGRDVRAPSN